MHALATSSEVATFLTTSHLGCPSTGHLSVTTVGQFKGCSSMRPQSYSHSFVVTQHTAFRLVDEYGKERGLSRIGMFEIGRVVWLPTVEAAIASKNNDVLGWAEGKGFVSIHPGHLRLV